MRHSRRANFGIPNLLLLPYLTRLALQSRQHGKTTKHRGKVSTSQAASNNASPVKAKQVRKSNKKVKPFCVCHRSEAEHLEDQELETELNMIDSLKSKLLDEEQHFCQDGPITLQCQGCSKHFEKREHQKHVSFDNSCTEKSDQAADYNAVAGLDHYVCMGAAGSSYGEDVHCDDEFHIRYFRTPAGRRMHVDQAKKAAVDRAAKLEENKTSSKIAMRGIHGCFGDCVLVNCMYETNPDSPPLTRITDLRGHASAAGNTFAKETLRIRMAIKANQDSTDPNAIKIHKHSVDSLAALEKHAVDTLDNYSIFISTNTPKMLREALVVKQIAAGLAYEDVKARADGLCANCETTKAPRFQLCQGKSRCTPCCTHVNAKIAAALAADQLKQVLDAQAAGKPIPRFLPPKSTVKASVKKWKFFEGGCKVCRCTWSGSFAVDDRCDRCVNHATPTKVEEGVCVHDSTHTVSSHYRPSRTVPGGDECASCYMKARTKQQLDTKIFLPAPALLVPGSLVARYKKSGRDVAVLAETTHVFKTTRKKVNNMKTELGWKAGSQVVYVPPPPAPVVVVPRDIIVRGRIVPKAEALALFERMKEFFLQLDIDRAAQRKKDELAGKLIDQPPPFTAD